ncbi:MAG: response regulator [Elusimicrobia bacterium]|nr:response regulator [Elusimicrobiota bacterium]
MAAANGIERSINVLLIEDDPDDALLLSHLMAKSDWPAFRFVMECAQTLEEGLKILAQGKTEVVLLDLALPDSHGLETPRRVHAAFPDVPVVVLTGLRDEGLGLEAVLQGAQDYQVKGSIDAHAFKRTISYAVERHRMSRRFRGLLESLADAVLVIDEGDVVRYRNSAAQKLFGGTSAALLDQKVPFKLSKDPVAELTLGERFIQMRVSEIEWSRKPARLAVLRDMTDLRKVEQLKAEVKEQRRMDKLKDELMGAVSHEMRNPLTIIKAVAVDQREGMAGVMNERQKEMATLQFRNILRLQQILDHILDLARLESGRADIRPRRFEPAQLVKDSVTGARLMAAKSGVKIDVELGADLPALHADPALFSQTLGNLLDNALRFAKSKISVRAKVHSAARAGTSGKSRSAVAPSPAMVEFRVIDDGPGIPKTRQAEIFTKFVQIDRRPRVDGYKGTGLGLAICKESVERQGGQIWVEGEEGHGASFHFTLPRYEGASKRGGDDEG